MSRNKTVLSAFLMAFCSYLLSAVAFAATAGPAAEKAAPLWGLIVSGGGGVIFLGAFSVAAVALVIYHFRSVVPHKLTPPDFIENLLFLLEKKEYEKAVSVCRQQENLVSAGALKGLQKISKGKSVVEEAIQY